MGECIGNKVGAKHYQRKEMSQGEGAKRGSKCQKRMRKGILKLWRSVETNQLGKPPTLIAKLEDPGRE